MRQLRCTAVLFSLLLMVSGTIASARLPRAGLSFNERVRLQEIVERVGHRHLVGDPPSLDNAAARRSIRQKVAGQLAYEALLGARMGRALSSTDLEAELARIERETQDPQRLSELREALGDDDSRLLEGWVRPTLVGRLLLGDTDLVATSDATGDPARPGWEMIPPLPETWEYHCAVWTGTHMIVWGGVSAAGRSYDPAAHAWSPISTVGQPPPARECSAVWTGTRMIVWGGLNPGPTNAGGSYDPVSDTWSPVSTLGAPSPRRGHSAVWTGHEMLVWGGGGSFGTDTGGRYDPASDSWAPMSTVNAPEPRLIHGAIWTGSEMIIWGGTQDLNINVHFATGGRYDPFSDTWESLPVTPATPSPRSFHTTVWTGSEMIIWGGRAEFGTNFGDGGRFNPGTNQWEPIPPDDAPSPRHSHGAVWTGRQMLVWGGISSSTTTTNTRLFSDGASFSPANGHWTKLKHGRSPDARFNFTTIWSGREMLVWGGHGGPAFDSLDDGGLYAPARRIKVSNGGSL